MKVWLLLSQLGHGGLERVQLNIAKGMHAKGIAVSIVAGQVIANVERELPRALPVIELAKKGPWHFPAAVFHALRRMKPDVVFTTSNDVACLLLLLRLVFFRKMRVIATAHLSMSAPRRNARGLKRAKLGLIRIAMWLLLPGAERVVAVSEGVAQDIRQELSPRNIKVRVIHNPIVTPDFEAHASDAHAWPWSDRTLPTIIFVGRLSAVKRLDLLLDSFQSFIQSTPARLLIVGTGPLQKDIEERIQREDMDACCKLTGFIENPLPLVSASDVLVLPSDYEGFGNVLVEAMACGTQVISTDCPYGPAEILADGQFGQLVPTNDARALETAIRKTLLGQSFVPPALLKERARDFTVEVSVHRYIELLSPTPG